jgi:hypothetical protein
MKQAVQLEMGLVLGAGLKILTRQFLRKQKGWYTQYDVTLTVKARSIDQVDGVRLYI